MRGNSPMDVALYASIVIGGFAGVIVAIIHFFFFESPNWVIPTLTGLCTFLFSWIVFYFSLEKFIYSKIRIIYKTIHKFKMHKGAKPDIDMNKDVFVQVNKEVMHWAEDKIKEIKTLKDQESFRREFIGNLSHEVKTPLFSIQGYILTLLEGGLEDPMINREFLMKAAKGVDRITNIVEDLNMITRLESNQFELNLKKTNLVGLTKEVMESLEIKAKKKKIDLTMNRNYEKPIFVEADKKRVEQVLTNLIENSINYGREKGQTELRFFDMDENILVEVADNGIGISEDHLPRLFERFYRVDQVRSRHEGGSGLGLAIVKHIIEAHGQTINVRSTEGVGSAFSFTLKRA